MWFAEYIEKPWRKNVISILFIFRESQFTSQLWDCMIPSTFSIPRRNNMRTCVTGPDLIQFSNSLLPIYKATVDSSISMEEFYARSETWKVFFWKAPSVRNMSFYIVKNFHNIMHFNHDTHRLYRQSQTGRVDYHFGLWLFPQITFQLSNCSKIKRLNCICSWEYFPGTKIGFRTNSFKILDSYEVGFKLNSKKKA